MAHFAKLDDSNIVISVDVIANETINNLSYPESEPVGIAFLTDWSNGYTNWKQTSYNNNFRVRYAGIGYTYSEQYDAFIPPQPYPSWILNTTTLNWDAPVPYPKDGKFYVWDEDTQTWILAVPQPPVDA